MYMLVISLLYVLAPDLFLRGFFREWRATSAEQIGVRANGRAAAAVRGGVQPARRDADDLRRRAQRSRRYAVPAAGEPGAGALLATFSYLSVEVWKLSVYGCWTLIVFWCLIAAVTYLVRFLAGQVAAACA